MDARAPHPGARVWRIRTRWDLAAFSIQLRLPWVNHCR